MSSDNPLATWQANFKRDLQMLSQLILLRTPRSHEAVRKEMRPLFQSVSDSLSELEGAKTHLEKFASAQRAQLSRLQQFHQAVALQKRRVTAIRACLPAELSESLGLNGDPTPPVSRVGSADTAGDEGKENQAANAVGGNGKAVDKPVKKKNVAKKPVGSSAPPRPKSSAKSKVQKKATTSARGDEIPVIRGVEQDELDAAPQYVKGRLTVDKISGVVTKLNEIARKKYILLAQPFRELNSSDMTARQEMEEAECPETEGRQFLTDTDIRAFGGYRMDATVKGAITMLRHTGALKEVRGKNRKRILIIQ